MQGSSNEVRTGNSWAKVWTTKSDGVDSGKDWNKLEKRQGKW